LPATRSRTENWRRSLEQLCERNGSLEIAVAQHVLEGGAEPGDEGNHLIWRVRLLKLAEDGIIVEQPSALGQTIHLDESLCLVAVIAIGQNRWMFRTTILERTRFQLNDRMKLIALRLEWPEKVERCQRRAFYRVSTVALSLPDVHMYPLLEPGSVWQAEEDSRARSAISQEALLRGDQIPEARPVLPQVGPEVTAKLINIGGGGVGLMAGPEHAALINNHRQYWLQLALPPVLMTPFGVQARLAHTHLDSAQNMYLGMQFEFNQSPSYRQFIVDQVCRYVTEMQREQLRRLKEMREAG
jgi:hypothetical protein